MNPSLTTSSDTCTKCGINKKSGRHSCCARGGAWFKNCGDAGDTHVDHTWTEGIEACRYSAGDASVRSSLQDTLRNVGTLLSGSRDATGQETNIPRTDIDANFSESEKCMHITFVSIVLFAHMLSIIS